MFRALIIAVLAALAVAAPAHAGSPVLSHVLFGYQTLERADSSCSLDYFDRATIDYDAAGSSRTAFEGPYNGTFTAFGRVTVSAAGLVTSIAGRFEIQGSGGVVTGTMAFPPGTSVSGNFCRDWTQSSSFAATGLRYTAVLPDGTLDHGTVDVFFSDTSVLGAFTAAFTSGRRALPPDTTAPTLNLPGDRHAEATGPDGARVGWTASAVDDRDGPMGTTCTPQTGSTFPLGRTTVTCTATDAAGNTGTGTFVVTVADTTAPALTVPGDFAADVLGGATIGRLGVVVATTVTAVDVVSGAVTATCLPGNGAELPIGVTTVRCTAVDAAGNAAHRSFTVTVPGPADLMDQLERACSASLGQLGPVALAVCAAGVAELRRLIEALDRVGQAGAKVLRKLRHELDKVSAAAMKLAHKIGQSAAALPFVKALSRLGAMAELQFRSMVRATAGLLRESVRTLASGALLDAGWDALDLAIVSGTLDEAIAALDQLDRGLRELERLGADRQLTARVREGLDELRRALRELAD